MNKQLNIEIKAKSNRIGEIRSILIDKNADFKGTDNQIDTYFHSKDGRFKLRKGDIENSLIFYDRENKSGPKKSRILFYHPNPESNLKDVLEAACGIMIEVFKKREIYFIDNVKFHLDKVKDLGNFVEIEAIGGKNQYTEEQLYEQCNHYLKLFGINADDLLESSYSDMLLSKRSN